MKNTKLINVDELQTETTLDCLIEQEFCVMITKMEQDKLKRTLKQEKLLAHKDKLKEPADISVKEFNNLKKQIKQLTISTKNTKKSKNDQGKPIAKKVGNSQKPKQTNQQVKKGNKPKNSNRNGNTKNTVAKRQ